MSVVVAVKKDGVVYMGADSQVTRGGTRVSLSNPNNYKVWKVKGCEHCLMGHVGSLRDACVIKLLNNIVRELDVLHDSVNFEFVVNRVVPLLIDELMARRYLSSSGKLEFSDSRFLFAYKDRLYVIGSDFSVIEVDDCVAIGSGESEAIGSLLTTSYESNPIVRIIKAIKSSAAHDIYVDYPIILSDTNKAEFTVLTENNVNDYIKDSLM